MTNELRIEYLSASSLTPFTRNARTHSKKQIKQIADSIKQNGFTNPILIDEHNMIMAGHGRLSAAVLIGMEHIPCVRLEHMTLAQKKAYVLADNKLALKAGWDDELVALELQELLQIDAGFDISFTGFSIAEADILIEGLSVEEPAAPEDERLPDPASGPAVTKLGDLFQLGPHRLICGDALNADLCGLLMSGELAQMVFSDPPYNVPIKGHVSGLGAIQHREFGMVSGDLDTKQFTGFLDQVFQNFVRFSKDGSIHFQCMDWRHMREILDAGEKNYSELKNLMVWAKDNGGMGTFYRSRHELIFAFKKGAAPHINSFELGQHGRYRTNVWNYKGMNSFGGARAQELAWHPTVKPVAMIADAIKDVSMRGGIVLDLFGGSGSTLIAAHKTGRRGYLAELDPLYCDLIIRRWQVYAKDDAVLVSTGQTFDNLAEERSRPAGGPNSMAPCISDSVSAEATASAQSAIPLEANHV